jgi:hypothetical protein
MTNEAFCRLHKALDALCVLDDMVKDQPFTRCQVMRVKINIEAALYADRYQGEDY